MCDDVGGTLLGVGKVGFVAVIAFDGSVETSFALGRAICSAAGVKVCWMLLRADVAVLVASALGGVVAEGKAFGALGVRAER